MHPQMKGTVQPTSFITKLKRENELFRSSMHQDAHEFLNYMLNKIVEDLEESTKGREDLSRSVVSTRTSSGSSTGGPSHRPNTLVQMLFEGILTNETRCLTCETVSSRDESFLDLSIDIEQNSSVTACLKQFSASEMLCEKNKFFCDSCCGLQEAEKRMKIKRLPNVLALHLKRFKHNCDEDKYVKLGYRVAFPLELRLFNTADDAEDPDRLFQLFSFVVHIGGGPHQGHYITIVKSYGGVWRVFDDDTVSTILESDIPKYFGDTSTAAGYVLFYQAVDLDPEAIGLSPKATPVVANGYTNTVDSPMLVLADSRASPSTQPHFTGLSTSVTHSNPHESAAAIQVSDETEPLLPSPQKLNMLASGAIKSSEPSVVSSNPSTSSQALSTSFFRKKDGLSPESEESSPARRPLHKEPSSLFSPLPHTGEKDKEKEHHRPSWFRTRRKDSLPADSSISQGATSNPDSAAVGPSSSPSHSSYHSHVVQWRQSSTNLQPVTIVRPLSIPDLPQLSPSARPTSTLNPEVPPVPRLPTRAEPSPISSTHHFTAPPSPHHVTPTSQEPSGHGRRPSLSKSSISAFIKSRTAAGTLSLDSAASHPVTPTLPTMTNLHKSPQQLVTRTSGSGPLVTGDPDSSHSESVPVVNSRRVNGERLQSSTSTSRTTSTIDSLPHGSETEAALGDLFNRSFALLSNIADEPRPAPPLVEKEKEREKDRVKGGGLTKRASRKMSFSGGLSIFGGWGASSKDRDKDKKWHSTNGMHHHQQYHHRQDHHHHEPPLMEESEAFARISEESERRTGKRSEGFSSNGPSQLTGGLTGFSFGF